MRFGIFTPSNNTRWLNECYASLKAQTYADWFWVVLLNGDAQQNGFDPNDHRVHIIRDDTMVTTIGALKRYAAMATGPDCDILVELDHDDLLHAECLHDLADAFDKNSHVGFAYSDTVRFREDGALPTRFSEEYGWSKWYTVGVLGTGYIGVCQPAFDVTPQSLARIWYAPDHVRAWRRSTYEAIGGHDPKLTVCDDYELMLRTYLATEMHHIGRPLYAYRVHPDSASAEGGVLNPIIQQEQMRIGNEYRVRVAETWARRKGLALIDICSGPEPAEGYIGIDKFAFAMGNVPFIYKDTPPGYAYRFDLDSPWSVYANSVGVVRAQDALEHLKDKQHTMHEIHRVLVHGGWLFSDTPSTDGRGAFQDPTHVSYWNSNSFWYWTSEKQRKFLPGYPDVPHFQMWHLDNLFYDDWYKLHDIPYVRAHMSAIHEENQTRLPGPYDFNP